jgi:hypothetical protein
LRKEAGFAVSDRIVVHLAGDPEVEAAALAFSEYISGEVLARDLKVGAEAPNDANVTQSLELDSLQARVALRRLS